MEEIGARGPLMAPSSLPHPHWMYQGQEGSECPQEPWFPAAPPSRSAGLATCRGGSLLHNRRRWPPSQRPQPRRWLYLPPACSGLLRAKGRSRSEWSRPWVVSSAGQKTLRPLALAGTTISSCDLAQLPTGPVGLGAFLRGGWIQPRLAHLSGRCSFKTFPKLKLCKEC